MKNVVNNIVKNVVKHLVLSLSALAGVSSGCSLIANPNDHLGGTLEDGGGVDAPSPLDAPLLDTGAPLDTGVPADGGSMLDAGNDAGPPIPECTVASDCGTGPVQCVSSRCVFCASPLAAPVAVHSEMGMVRQFGMAVGNDGTTHEVELALIPHPGSAGMSPNVRFVRLSAVSPVAPTGGYGNALMGIETISSADFDRITSLDVATERFTATERYFDISVLGARLTSTIRTYVVTSPTTLVDSLTYPGADSVATPAADLAPIRFADVESAFGGAAVYRARLASGAIVLRAVETAYGNMQAEWAAPALPADPYAPIAVTHGLVAIGTTDARVILWDLQSAPGVVIPTPGRTGAPGLVEVSAGLYVLAYGAGSRIVLRSIECTGPSSTCTALSASLEIETGAVSIPRVELERSGDVVVLVAYEALAGGMGGQLALRAVRSDLSRVYHATSGDALPIEAFPGGSTRIVTDVHLDLATPAAGTRYVVGWMRSSSPADAIVDLRLQSIGSTCP